MYVIVAKMLSQITFSESALGAFYVESCVAYQICDIKFHFRPEVMWMEGLMRQLLVSCLIQDPRKSYPMSSL